MNDEERHIGYRSFYGPLFMFRCRSNFNQSLLAVSVIDLETLTATHCLSLSPLLSAIDRKPKPPKQGSRADESPGKGTFPDVQQASLRIFPILFRTMLYDLQKSNNSD